MSPLAEWQACALLRQADLDAMRAAGVQALALVSADDGTGGSVARDRVVVHPQGRRFEFSRYSRGAFLDVAGYILPAFDRHGDLADLVAFSCSNAPFAATWLGRIGLLGEEQVETHVARPLRVWPTVLDWLRAGRDGVVVVDPVRAGPMLRESGQLVVGSSAERRRLADLMRARLPSIEIEAPARRAAAK